MSMMRSNKLNAQQREPRWFEIFCEQYPLKPNKVIHGDCPDVIFEINGKKIGLEITELYHNQSDRRMESIKDRICREGENLCERANLPPRRVTIFGEVIKKDKKHLAEKLFDFIKNKPPGDYNDPESPCLLSEIECNNIEILPSGIYCISISDMDINKHCWKYRDATEDILTPELLQVTIDKKDLKYTQYHQGKDVCWLLITAVGNRSSSVFEMVPNIKNQVFVTRFDKVFFLDGFGHVLDELKVQKPNPISPAE